MFGDNALDDIGGTLLGVGRAKVGETAIDTGSLFVSESTGRLCEGNVNDDVLVELGSDVVSLFASSRARMLDVERVRVRVVAFVLEATDIDRLPGVLLGCRVVELEGHLAGGGYKEDAAVSYSRYDPTYPRKLQMTWTMRTLPSERIEYQVWVSVWKPLPVMHFH